MIGYLLCDDLMFSSRITAEARALNLQMKVARSAADIERLAAVEPAACIILDLGNPGLQITDMIGRIKPTGQTLPFVVAYGSHVDTATLNAAREAGCNVVLPRSKFVEELPRSLAKWFGIPGAAAPGLEGETHLQ